MTWQMCVHSNNLMDSAQMGKAATLIRPCPYWGTQTRRLSTRCSHWFTLRPPISISLSLSSAKRPVLYSTWRLPLAKVRINMRKTLKKCAQSSKRLTMVTAKTQLKLKSRFTL